MKMIARETPGWHKASVLLDGAVQRWCFEADEEQGYLLRAVRENDKIKRGPDNEIITERVTGHVQIIP